MAIDRVQRAWFLGVSIADRSGDRRSVEIGRPAPPARDAAQRRRGDLPAVFAALLVVDLVAPARVPRSCCGWRRARWWPFRWRSSPGFCGPGWPGRARRPVRRLPTMPPAELQAALARVLGDPGLRIAYPRGRAQFVDAGAGARRASRRPARSRPVERRPPWTATGCRWRRWSTTAPWTTTRSSSRRSAAAASRWRTGACRPQAQERLAELQASRERIVTAADAERRRIERNLHDGAQQGLVTLALHSRCSAAHPRRPGRRRAAGRPRERRARRSWPSCASWPAGSTRPRSSRASGALEALVMRSAVPAPS